MTTKNGEKFFSWRDAIYLAGFVVSITSVIISNQIKIGGLEERVMKVEKQLQDNNLELIVYKIGQLDEKQNQFNTAFTKFLDDYYNRSK
ncbi:MAG: hypothetical protein M0P71_16560 [Melioribacteraceae bacterium]|jgi:hypothetical protein|nr:hypothetical protein [Melioribacteraceae bacterium]